MQTLAFLTGRIWKQVKSSSIASIVLIFLDLQNGQATFSCSPVASNHKQDVELDVLRVHA
jgi:hypothetical protein